ncbi:MULTISPECIES: hypothetical protein [unclassified Streptomyces]|uniref:hypothetical protein n=1 Tax=unclassified Streptomyces TaxID=2593676 RepID=UPI00296604D0|nr:hypothetical protein [Streptomyces sp. SJL17-1]
MRGVTPSIEKIIGAEAPLAALQVAEQRVGAERGRWGNKGVADSSVARVPTAGEPDTFSSIRSGCWGSHGGMCAY